jgi:hypothetical protein
MWPWGVLGVLYAVTSIVVTNFSWDEDIDDFYGDLKTNLRYVFFAVMLIFWPVWVAIFYVKRLRRGKVREDD